MAVNRWAVCALTILGWSTGALVLAACTGGTDGDVSTAIAGRYSVSQATGTCGAVALNLLPHADGTLTIPGYHFALREGTEGTFSGAVGECVPYGPSPYVDYFAGRVTKTSDTTIHVEIANAVQHVAVDACSVDAGLALAPQATVLCSYDATITARAPVITSIAPLTISRTDCTKQLTLDVAGFIPGRIGYAETGIASYPATENCMSGWSDTDGNTVCPLVMEKASSTRIVAHLDPDSWAPYECFPAGTLQLEIMSLDESDPTGNGLQDPLQAFTSVELVD